MSNLNIFTENRLVFEKTPEAPQCNPADPLCIMAAPSKQAPEQKKGQEKNEKDAQARAAREKAEQAKRYAEAVALLNLQANTSDIINSCKQKEPSISNSRKERAQAIFDKAYPSEASTGQMKSTQLTPMSDLGRIEISTLVKMIKAVKENPAVPDAKKIAQALAKTESTNEEDPIKEYSAAYKKLNATAKAIKAIYG